MKMIIKESIKRNQYISAKKDWILKLLKQGYISLMGKRRKPCIAIFDALEKSARFLSTPAKPRSRPLSLRKTSTITT
jgi:hypothetical protein